MPVIGYPNIHHACMSNSCVSEREIRKANVQATMSHQRSNMLHATLMCDDEFPPILWVLPCYTNFRCNKTSHTSPGHETTPWCWSGYVHIIDLYQNHLLQNPWQIKGIQWHQMKVLIWNGSWLMHCKLHYTLQLISYTKCFLDLYAVVNVAYVL